MSWNPVEARKCLNASPLVEFIREVDKLAAFKFRSGRELVLIKENTNKVSLYLSVAPQNMPDVILDGVYPPSSKRVGRHANLASLTQTLGFKHHAFKVEVKSAAGLALLLAWYQYA